MMHEYDLLEQMDIKPDLSSQRYPIRKIFQRFLPEYALSHTLSEEQWSAAQCISSCKSGKLGYNISYCESCGHIEIHARSCNNRHCPCCQSSQEKKWVLARNSELIEGCAYYHAIFTVPSELYDIIYTNQKGLYNLMFSCVSESLICLCKDKRYLGATPGIIMVLHTWGQQLNYHPHIHCCLSGCGLTPSNTFAEGCHKGFLLPVKAVAKVFRGKFLEKLNHLYENEKLLLPASSTSLAVPHIWKSFLDSLYHKEFLPFIKETFNGNGNAITYLARYAYRTAISNSRIENITDLEVSFRYKDYKNGSETRIKTVSGEEFLNLFLKHILPKGFTRVRFAGYLSNCCKTKKLKLIHALRNTIYHSNPVKGLRVDELMLLLYNRDICSCRECSRTMIRLRTGGPPGHTLQRLRTLK